MAPSGQNILMRNRILHLHHYANSLILQLSERQEMVIVTPKELVANIANITGISEATVTVHDRYLVNAGLRSKCKRGRGVAFVSPDDAANLLVSVVGSRGVKDAAKTVAAHKETARSIAEDVRRISDGLEPLRRSYTVRQKMGVVTIESTFTADVVTALAELMD